MCGSSVQAADSALSGHGWQAAVWELETFACGPDSAYGEYPAGLELSVGHVAWQEMDR